MNKFLSNSKLFLKRNSSTILTCIGAAGVVATAISSVRDTTKASKIIEANKELRGDKPFTKKDIIACTWRCYIPTVAIATSTIACIFGANVLNNKNQAALTSAYALLDQAYREYKTKTEELYGKDATKKVLHSIAEDRLNEEEVHEPVSNTLFMDFNSLQFFESTFEKVKEAENTINNLLNTRGYVFLNDYYESLGLNLVDTDYQIGWSKTTIYEAGYDSIPFVYEKVASKDGKECIGIITLVDPVYECLF